MQVPRPLPRCHVDHPDVSDQHLGKIVIDDYMERAAMALEVNAKKMDDGTPLDIKPAWLAYRLACALQGRKP